MMYFTEDYLDFFRELEKNNSKEWFRSNIHRYISYVREPMIEFVKDVISEMQKHDNEMDPDPIKCLGRINRDIRFSKDKTPYHPHLFAHITKGTKDNPIPGIAFRFGAKEGGIMTGYYRPSKGKLQDIRRKIGGNLAHFQSLISDPDFIEKYGSIKGAAYKRIPRELQDIYEHEPLIANKQFYYMKELEAAVVLSKDLKESVIAYWLAAKPLNDFFA